VLEVFDILKLLADKGSLEIFNIVALKGKIDAKTT